MTSVSPEAFQCPFAAEANGFRGQIDDFGPLEAEQKKATRKGLKVMCRECQMGVAAAQKALAHAGLRSGQLEPERTGVAFGSDYMLTLAEDFTESVLHCLSEEGEFDFAVAAGWDAQMSPAWLLKYLPTCLRHLQFNESGHNSLTLRKRCPHCVGEATRRLHASAYRVMIAARPARGCTR